MKNERLEGAKMLIEILLKNLLRFTCRCDVTFEELWIVAGESMDECVEKIKKENA